MNAVTYAVNFYRARISPHKGFRCAYAVAYGRGSCSDVGLRLASRVPLLRFFRLMSLQARRCKSAYLSLQSTDLEREWADSEGRNDKDAERQVLGCMKEGAVCGVSCCPWP